jgi:hypothetical protein
MKGNDLIVKYGYYIRIILRKLKETTKNIRIAGPRAEI